MDNKKRTYFLITGMARSGTTLVEKVLNEHPEIMALSQPIPKIYSLFKKEFLLSLNCKDIQYPLNNLFNETRYTRQDFLQFLSNQSIGRNKIFSVLKEMEGWTGQKTDLRESEFLKRKFSEFKLQKIYKDLISHFSLSSQVAAAGSKEIIIEEFTEFFLNHNCKIIIVVRDPRDVFTSINVGKGSEYAGHVRPTLFHLRNWRKSVAIVNTFKDHPNFFFLRYEDFIQDTGICLGKLTNFLGVSDFERDIWNETIKDKDGKEWTGNSSTGKHRGINSSNTGKYLDHLNETTINYIEYICGPEMKALGYKNTVNEDFPVLFQEPFKVVEQNLDQNMSTNPKELGLEKMRRNFLLEEHPSKENIQMFFFSKENFNVLKESYDKT
ncbi:sulfotransferase domain-containing protein [Christiangramia crocea]|uniref:Sulfotransferase domain-containing protein n=1 Tax=Christiangramia crocea TaxID=2904124 RepID=A0A9X1UUB8_9FLAO|nr:sulfotransferase domain-containing protein [Gramella crocea]MCG9970434.1 sulfotransferase domain-containing protein [Gramella crocea]